MITSLSLSFFFFNDTATTEIYTLSLHDALPIYQRQSPERNREGRCRSEPDDGSGVAGGEHCHDQHEERRHGRETSPPSPRSATGCRPRSPPPNCALHAPPARVARRDIAPRPYGRGSARSPRSVAVRPQWSLGHTLPRAPHRGG